MHTLYLVSVWLHIIAAMTWMGGMLFLVTVVVPMLRKPELRERAAELFHTLGLRFRTVGWVALVTLVVTGTTNILFRGFTFLQILNGEVFRGPWGHNLAMKLTLVLIVLVLGAAHDFWLGPRATKIALADPNGAARERSRKIASYMGRITMLLALLIVALAVTLVRG